MQEKYHMAMMNTKRNVSLDAFSKYVLQSPSNYQDLFVKIKQIQTNDFPRFNIWRMLLGIMPIHGSIHDKKNSIEAHRKKWMVLKQQAKSGIKVSNSKQSTPISKNPLMKNIVKTQSKQVISDSFLLQQIKKDVERTYQEQLFFQNPAILSLLTTILFVWCKINHDISYKQGMNQVLASIIFVYFQQTIPNQFHPTTQIQQEITFFNSLAFVEADIYIVFEKIMAIQKDMYKQSLDEKIKGQVNPNSKNNSPILQRILQIQDQKLKHVDLQLFKVMKLQNVVTKTFLLKWIRCLHTRQFGLVNSLFIWDSIFLDYYESPNSKNRNQYEFIDAMCLAMFIYLRAIVFTRETANEILTIYQKFPSLEVTYLKQLLSLGWSVCQQLRQLTNNSNKNTNWYEESQKAKKLGLMQKGGYDQTMKNQQSSPVKQPIKQTIKQPVFIKKEQQKVAHQIKHSNGSEKNPFNHQNSKVSHEEEKIFVIQNTEKPKRAQKIQVTIQDHPKQSKSSITFEIKEIIGMIQNLKKSIALNDDIESRALANKALKILQRKIQK